MASNSFIHFKDFPQLPALRELITKKGFGKDDVMVVFGEIFSRGYANGILDEAQRAGMKVIRSTVGRRDDENQLRKLNAEELALQIDEIINIPLEAGFDLEKSGKGQSPCDMLAGVKMNDWDKVKLDWEQIHDSRERATKRFRSSVEKYMAELAPKIPAGKNVLFVHTMAGGVPRAKILMPTINKIFKGQGDRYLSSEVFWQTDIGKFCSMNFEDVTANTFKHLLDASGSIREKQEKAGARVSYVAYGYHGTETLIDNEFKWQTNSPYLQGWAKMNLENFSFEAREKGIHSCVYNCAEILTNSSSIFLGVEISLYPLLGAIQNLVKKNHSKHGQAVLDKCQSLLKPEFKISDVISYCNAYLKDPTILAHCDFKKWPQHNSPAQMARMLDSCYHLRDMHKSDKDLIVFVLSEEVFKGTGHMMFFDSFDPKSPVSWINHDILAKCICKE